MEEHICRFNTDADNPSKQPNIARAQARGEVAPGDPRLHAFSLIGPMVMVMPFREVFGGVGTDPPDLGLMHTQATQASTSAIRDQRVNRGEGAHEKNRGSTPRTNSVRSVSRSFRLCEHASL